MDVFDVYDLRQLDPNGGVLVSTTYWRPICPNPGMQGYSLLHSQAARFTPIAAETVYGFMQDDIRLYCVQDTPRCAFWTYWGDPAYDTPPYGTSLHDRFRFALRLAESPPDSQPGLTARRSLPGAGE